MGITVMPTDVLGQLQVKPQSPVSKASRSEGTGVTFHHALKKSQLSRAGNRGHQNRPVGKLDSRAKHGTKGPVRPPRAAYLGANQRVENQVVAKRKKPVSLSMNVVSGTLTRRLNKGNGPQKTILSSAYRPGNLSTTPTAARDQRPSGLKVSVKMPRSTAHTLPVVRSKLVLRVLVRGKSTPLAVKGPSGGTSLSQAPVKHVSSRLAVGSRTTLARPAIKKVVARVLQDSTASAHAATTKSVGTPSKLPRQQTSASQPASVTTATSGMPSSQSAPSGVKLGPAGGTVVRAPSDVPEPNTPQGWTIRPVQLQHSQGTQLSTWTIRPPAYAGPPMKMELTQQGTQLKANLILNANALGLVNASPTALPHQAVHLPEGVSTLEFTMTTTQGGPNQGDQSQPQSRYDPGASPAIARYEGLDVPAVRAGPGYSGVSLATVDYHA